MSVVAAKVYDNNIQMSADSILTNGWEKTLILTLLKLFL